MVSVSTKSAGCPLWRASILEKILYFLLVSGKKDPKQVAGTHGFGSPCLFIFTDKPVIFAAGTSVCVCSKTSFQSMPSLDQASSELGNAFNPLAASLKRHWCRRLLFPAQRCILFPHIFKNQAISQPCFEKAAAQIIHLRIRSGEFTLGEFHLSNSLWFSADQKWWPFKIQGCSYLNGTLNKWKFIKRAFKNYSV